MGTIRGTNQEKLPIPFSSQSGSPASLEAESPHEFKAHRGDPGDGRDVGLAAESDGSNPGLKPTPS